MRLVKRKGGKERREKGKDLDMAEFITFMKPLMLFEVSFLSSIIS